MQLSLSFISVIQPHTQIFPSIPISDFSFQKQDLQEKYSSIRKTRPDGNCFYRAFGFSHLESLLEDSKELHK